MNGTSVIGSAFAGNNNDPTWNIVGTGDFNDDGKSDILLQNTNSGELEEWQMNGLSVTNSCPVGHNNDPS
jgi:hypothetical protein